jgi:hypothetical protein
MILIRQKKLTFGPNLLSEEKWQRLSNSEAVQHDQLGKLTDVMRIRIIHILHRDLFQVGSPVE